MHVHPAVSIAVTSAALLLGLAVTAAGQSDAGDPLTGPGDGPWRRLFLDATVMEAHSGLERVFHAAEKYQGNPLIVGDRPWEQVWRYPGPELHGTVLRDGDRLRMWYRCYSPQSTTCYAESTDGIAWTKPDLDICSWGDHRLTNIVDLGQVHFPLVFHRPWLKDPSRRYILFCMQLHRGRKHGAAYSPDGLHWTFAPQTAETPLFSGGDATNYGWDPYSARYFGMRKTASYGLGGRSESGRGRAVGIAWSDPGDELRWTVPIDVPVLAPDDLDPDATQFYNAPAFAYQGMFIAQVWVYHARWFKYGVYTDERMVEAEAGSPCTTDVQLAWSWDLVNWTRTPDRKPFIALGDSARNDFDCGSIHTARAPVLVGDRLHFYYAGTQGRYLNPRPSAIGLATLRLDGFCSMHADDREGWLITRREPMLGPEVMINASTAGDGYVIAELLDRDGNVLPGFSREECVPFTGDSARHTLRWQSASLDEVQRTGDQKLRFFLRNADLYSYLPTQLGPGG